MINGVDLIDRAHNTMSLLLSVQTEQVVPELDEDGALVDHKTLRAPRMLTPRERKLWNSAVEVIEAVYRRAGVVEPNGRVVGRLLANGANTGDGGGGLGGGVEPHEPESFTGQGL